MRRPVLIIALLLLCYGYTLPRWADWSQTSRLALVRALVEQRSVQIDRYVGSTGDYALVNGRAYSDKAPGPALLATPCYALLRPLLQLPAIAQALGRIAGSAALASTLKADGAGLGGERVALAVSHYLLTLIVIALPAALSTAVLDWLLRRWFRPAPALAGTLAYGLATPVAAYAGNFYSHALVAALLLGGWAGIERAADTQHRRWWLGGSGLLLGWAVISEYPAALIAAALGMYALWRCGWRAASWLSLGGMPALALLIAYDLAAFGTPWPVGYAYSALWQEQHHSGFLSISYPRPTALWGLSFGGFRGLFPRAPWLLLALPGIYCWWRTGHSRSRLLLAIAATLSLWLFYGSSRMWWGGFAAGPRYIVPLLPFLALPAVGMLDRLWERRGWRWLALLLIGLSIALVWSEALAAQQFPPDSIADPWREWTLPAWQRGDIARNLGMALGLRGSWSLLPLLVGAAVLLTLLLRTTRPQPEIRRFQPVAALR
jgi:hypothetical protein